nr:hypothetical protein [Oenococcus oeni]
MNFSAEHMEELPQFEEWMNSSMCSAEKFNGTW